LFKGEQISSFSEAVYKYISGTGEWLIGANFYSEDFNDESEVARKRNYTDITYGSFINNISDISGLLSLETGLRFDYNNDYGFFPLPRVNLLIKWDEKIKSRIGGGFGYKIPTIFTERSDELAFRNIIPIDIKNTKAEKSYGFNFDLDYSTILFEEITLSINNLFFYTRINDPLALGFNNTNNYYEYQTYNGYFDTKGIETNIKLTYDHYKLFAGYTFTDVKSHSGEESSAFPLTPKHRLGLVLIYEIHGNLRIGLEAYYTGKQRLSDGSVTTDYWINGLMLEKRFNNFSLFLNFENFLDTRQSKYGPTFTGFSETPNFVEIYAPTDGRIINGGIKFNL
jgi:iron complex outermembrane receptor protein